MSTRFDAALAAFEAAARGASLVTFDLFDTLLLRTLREPRDVFAVMADQLRPAAPALAGRFPALRVAAEEQARRTVRAAGGREVTHAAIYDHMPEDFVAQARAQGIGPRDLMEREVEVELACAVPDARVVAAFDRIVASGVPVAVVSDMYLPGAVLHRLLARIGVAGHGALHLSCEADGCKADGSVWPVVRAHHGLGPTARIVHIGDHPDSDGATARRCGIEAFTLPLPAARHGARRMTELDHWLAGACEALLARALRQHVGDSDVDPYWLGLAHRVVLPVALGMGDFVARTAEDRGLDAVFFLARDGLIFQRVYEAAFRRPGMPASGYVHASRRCLNMASIERLDEAELRFLTLGFHRLSPADYLRRIDIDPAEPAVAQALAHRFADPEQVVDEAGFAAMGDLFQAIEPLVLARAAMERGPLLDHLTELDVFEHRALVVDLGWHGSLQRSLAGLGQLATGRDVTIEGAYLGVMGAVPVRAEERPIARHGWLFGPGEAGDARAMIEESVEVVELLFSAPSPGVRHLYRDGARIAVASLEEREEAQRLRIACIIHQAVEQAATLLAPLVSTVAPDDLRALATGRLARLLRHPDGDDIAHFRAAVHAEGFGAARYVPIIPPHPALPAPGALLRAYRVAFWRRGFLAGLPPLHRLSLLAGRIWSKSADRLAAQLNSIRDGARSRSPAAETVREA